MVKWVGQVWWVSLVDGFEQCEGTCEKSSLLRSR